MQPTGQLVMRGSLFILECLIISFSLGKYGKKIVSFSVRTTERSSIYSDAFPQL